MSKGIARVWTLAILIWFPARAFSQSNTLDQAMNLFRQKNWAAAATAFAKVEQTQPGQTDALLYQAKCLVNLGQFSQSTSALQVYMSKHPNSDDAAYLIAYTRFRENNPQDSLRLFTAAAKLKPPAADDLKVIALDYVLLNDYSSAARYLEQALQLNPINVEALYHLGRVRYQLNQFDQAIAAFQEVLKHDPNNTKAYGNLGLSYEGKNDTTCAIDAYRRAIQLDKASLIHAEQPYLDIGILLTKLNRTEEALPFFEQAVQIAPKSGKLHREYGKAFLELSRLLEAQHQVEVACTLEPADASSHYLLGRIYHRLGRNDLASREFTATNELMRTQRENSKASGMASQDESK